MPRQEELMERKYAILRSRARQATRGPEITAGMTAVGASPEKANVEVADLSPREVTDLTRDEGVAVVAPVMPITLIQPLAAPTANTGPAWGIEAVGASNTAFDGKGVLVCVLDTGIDSQHAAFAGVTL